MQTNSNHDNVTAALLLPLWKLLKTNIINMRRYDIKIVDSYPTPSHQPTFPFDYVPSKKGLTCTCTAPNMKKWRIHILGTYRDYHSIPVFNMFVWLYIVHSNLMQSTSPKCLTTGLDVYIYPTKEPKKVPESGPLGPAHVNTAYTYSCPIKGEIIIYRREEMFKVFIHETMHAAGYDFSQMDSISRPTTATLFRTYPIATFESFSEFWGRVWNLLFAQYTVNPIWSSQSIIRRLCIEQRFAIQQMNRVLQYNKITYPELLTLGVANYREKTHVLAYYVVTAAMFFSFHDTVVWCIEQHNKNSPYQFYGTYENIHEFNAFLNQLTRFPLFITYTESREAMPERGNSMRMSSRANDVMML